MGQRVVQNGKREVMAMKKRKAILKEALKCKDLKKLEKEAFLNAWHAVAFLYPYLHPDEIGNPDGGWPKRLKPLAMEVWRRLS
jgi:hypothetical protein